MSSFKDLSITVKLNIENPGTGKDFGFGPGIAKLCDGILETGSLNASAKKMGMAYSRAWRIINESEESLGIKLLNRNGAKGSNLTGEAIEILRTFHKLENDITRLAAEHLHKELGC